LNAVAATCILRASLSKNLRELNNKFDARNLTSS